MTDTVESKRKIRRIPISADMHQRFKLAAVQKQSSMSSVVVDILRDYAAGEPVRVAKKLEPLTAEVHYPEPAEYTEALNRARTEGVTLASVIREGIDRFTS